MNRVAFIIPFYGKLPEYYEAWRMTALSNEDFDFIFISDIEDIVSEKNIYVRKLSFKEIKQIAEHKFGFPVKLDSPYKLCDYKPAYGYLFKEFIAQYEFWGHCDIDVLLGDLGKFITRDILDGHDKIYEHGHMTIYRNTDSINTSFMNDGVYPEFNYEEVYTSAESFYFDEFYGMMLKSRRIGTKTYLNTSDFIDLNTREFDFFDVHNNTTTPLYFELTKKGLYAVNKTINEKREVAYVHFQKRKIDFSNFKKGYLSDRPVYIISNKIYFDIENTSKNIDGIKSLNYKWKRKFAHIRDFLKRYNQSKKEYKSLKDYYYSRQKIKERRKAAMEIIKE